MEIGKIGKITLCRDISERDLGDEIILIREGGDELHTFKEIGLDIWKLLKEGKTAGEVLTCLTGDYDIEENEAAEDLVEFLENCKEKGLINY